MGLAREEYGLGRDYTTPSDTFGTMDALSSDSNFYCVEKSDGYDLYEYPNHFIVHMDHLEEQFKNLKIYKYQKGTSTNEN